MHAVAIGDVFVDYLGDLTDPKYEELFASIDSGTNIFASVDVKVGGAGVQFAVAAKTIGFETSTLIGKIGGQLDENQRMVPDLPGKMVIEFLQRRGVRPLLAMDPASETGRIVIIFFPGDRRLMLSDRLANALFSRVDISPMMEEAVRQADLIHLSGYTLLQESRRTAILELVRCTKEGAGKVALDIVPHDIYKLMSFEQLCSSVDNLADWAIVDIAAAHQLLGLGQLKRISSDLIEHIMGVLTSVFPSVALHLDPSYAIVVDGSERFEYTTEYQPGTTSRGQSARAQVELLYWRLNR